MTFRCGMQPSSTRQRATTRKKIPWRWWAAWLVLNRFLRQEASTYCTEAKRMPNHRRMPCRLGKREDLARVGDARLGSHKLIIFYESLPTLFPAISSCSMSTYAIISLVTLRSVGSSGECQPCSWQVDQSRSSFVFTPGSGHRLLDASCREIGNMGGA